MTRALLREAEDIRRTGSAALDIAYVAAGRLDGFYEIGLKPWDMAAACLLVREAGGKHCDFVGRDGMPESGNLLAGNIKVVDAMVKAIAPELTPALFALTLLGVIPANAGISFSARHSGESRNPFSLPSLYSAVIPAEAGIHCLCATLWPSVRPCWASPAIPGGRVTFFACTKKVTKEMHPR